jgi:lysophospholipase L1-like esterase
VTRPWDRSLRVCVIGDSIAAGTGDDRCLGWAGRLAVRALAAGADLTIYVLGVRGDTSEDVARRWRAEAAARLPATFPHGLVFQFGLNDCAVRDWDDGRRERRVEARRSQEVTRIILAEAAADGATLMIGPAPVDDERPGPQLVPGMQQHLHNDDIARLDVALEVVATGLGVPYLAVFETLHSDPTWRRALRQGDGIHPTGEGYEALAGLVAAWPAWQELLAATRGGPA